MEDKITKDSVKLQIIESAEKERECSDRKYAIKIIENIVFALVTLMCLAVVGALIKLVIQQ